MLRSLIFASVVFPLISCVSFDNEKGTVSLNISQGGLLGKRIDTYDNRTGYGFLGIPFGAPTDGSRRFTKPVPADSWEGVRDVTVKGPACAADAKLTYKIPEGGPMSEDCLHTYVYASRNCLTKGGCPVMFVLHGGRFTFESPVIFVDEVVVHNFASDGQDVVVVIPAYRLTNFGFLNIAPGLNVTAVPNVGVWDVLLAMDWTHREIHNFGGDPSRISLFGHSAGSSFVDMVSTSPLFAGKFSSIVMMSGADTTYEVGLEADSKASWVTAIQLGCADSDTNRTDVASIEKVIECLRSKSWQEIVEANLGLNNVGEDYRGPHADGPAGIFPEPPSKLLATRPAVPMLIGTTSAEFHDTKYAIRADIEEGNITRVAELCEGFCYATGYKNPREMMTRCMERYMEGNTAQSMMEDAMFYWPTYRSALSMAEKGANVYLYSFSYQGVGGAFKKFEKLGTGDHPAHSEDFVYILGMHRRNFTPRDYEIEKIYSGMVLNFLKTGYPHPGEGQPVWKPLGRVQKKYYEIDFDDSLRMPGMKSGYHAEAVKLWGHDADKYGGGISDPHEYPQHMDRVFTQDMVIAYSSHHLGKSTAHDKTFASTENSYRSWIDFVNSRRYQFMNGSMKLRSVEVEQPQVEGLPVSHNHLAEILVVFASAVLLFLLYRCCFNFGDSQKERKEYQQF